MNSFIVRAVTNQQYIIFSAFTFEGKMRYYALFVVRLSVFLFVHQKYTDIPSPRSPSSPLSPSRHQVHQKFTRSPPSPTRPFNDVTEMVEQEYSKGRPLGKLGFQPLRETRNI